MALKLGNFLIEIFNFTRYPFGGDNFYSDEKVTMFSASLHSFSRNPQRCIILDASRDFKVNVTFVYCLDLNRGSKDRSRRSYLDHGFEVVSQTFKP